jgi:hypothetical protein
MRRDGPKARSQRAAAVIEAQARAAQVQILREIADELAALEIGTSGDTVERETWWMAVGALRDKADELEQA